MAASLDVNHVREQFPGLQQKQVFFDNAGGSQTLGSVIKSFVSSNFYFPTFIGSCVPSVDASRSIIHFRI